MKKQAGSSAKELADMDTVNKFMDNEDYGIIGLFRSLTFSRWTRKVFTAWKLIFTYT